MLRVVHTERQHERHFRFSGMDCMQSRMTMMMTSSEWGVWILIIEFVWNHDANDAIYSRLVEVKGHHLGRAMCTSHITNPTFECEIL